VLRAISHQLRKVLGLSLLFSVSFMTHAEVELLIFPEIKANYQSANSFSTDNITPSVDIFSAGAIGPVNFLAEAYASENVQHIERLQIGFNMSDNSRVWFGRHHNPYGYWHTQFHHGTFLQTPISRPAIAELGSSSGIVPSHSTGVLIEGELEQGMSAWHYTASAGLTSSLVSAGGGHHGGAAERALHDFEISNPKPNEHKLGYALRLAYFPDALAETQFGGFINHQEIMLSLDTRIDEVDHLTDIIIHDDHHSADDDEHHTEVSEQDMTLNLNIVGLFASYHQGSLNLVGEAYYFSAAVPMDGQQHKSNFSAAYVHASYSLDEKWTPYIRLDTTLSNRNNEYLSLLDSFPTDAYTVGLRLDLKNNNAFKLEYSKRNISDIDSERWLLNWSAVW